MPKLAAGRRYRSLVRSPGNRSGRVRSLFAVKIRMCTGLGASILHAGPYKCPVTTDGGQSGSRASPAESGHIRARIATRPPQTLDALRAKRASRLSHRGFPWWCSLLPGSPLRCRWIEGIFDGLACVESHSLASGDLNRLSGSWIPPFACRPRRHIEDAKSGDTDRIPGDEGIENGIYHGLHRLARRSLV